MIANLRLLPICALCGVFDQLPHLSVMLTCVVVRRLSVVGCKSRGLRPNYAAFFVLSRVYRRNRYSKCPI